MATCAGASSTTPNQIRGQQARSEFVDLWAALRVPKDQSEIQVTSEV